MDSKTAGSPAESTESPVALVVADFMFGARVQAALHQMGWGSKIVGTPDAALASLRESRPRLALVELGAGNPSRIQLLRDVRALPEGRDLPLLAFGSHKAKPALEAARETGATMVVSNGTLVSRFRELVQKALEADLPEEERFITEDD
ncbi:MAG: hypothetical protein KY468_20155 [Armatimonadetes bacterium]|nr:hypothetical protein [Armatimonadota bacterium]